MSAYVKYRTWLGLVDDPVSVTVNPKCHLLPNILVSTHKEFVIDYTLLHPI